MLDASASSPPHPVRRSVAVTAAALLAFAPAALLASESEEPAATASVADLPGPLAAGWQGVPVCELLHEDESLRVLRCTFPPGAGHERHAHPRHFGYALSGGRMRLTDEKGTREVEAATGSSFASDGVAWHEVLNVGETTVAYLIVEPRADELAAGPHPDDVESEN